MLTLGFLPVQSAVRYQVCNFTCPDNSTWLSCRSEKCTPRLAEARTVYCVHSGAVIDETTYARRLEGRNGERYVTRKTF